MPCGVPELARHLATVNLSDAQPTFDVDFDLITIFDVIEHGELPALRSFCSVISSRRVMSLLLHRTR
jgi:hypothetical protein